MPWLISALGITIEKMKVGEFTRKLKEAVNAEGYTCNNVNLARIDYVEDTTVEESCLKVTCIANDGNEFSFFIED